MSSIEALLGAASVLMYNPIAYTRIHNEGGDMVSTPTVTSKMRKWFWAQYYKLEARAEEAKMSYDGRGRGGTEGGRGRGGTEGISYISW